MLHDLTPTTPRHAPVPRRRPRRLILAHPLVRRATFLTDAQGVIRGWSAEAECLLGYAAASIIGQSSACLLGPDITARRRLLREQAVARRDGSVERVTWRVHQDGTQVRLRVSLTPLLNSDGALSGYLHTLEPLPEARSEPMRRRADSAAREERMLQRGRVPMRTIGVRREDGELARQPEELAQRRLANELEQARAEARTTAAVLTALVDAHPGLVLICDAGGHIQRINATGVRLLGISAGDEREPEAEQNGGIAPMMALVAGALRGERIDTQRLTIKTPEGAELHLTVTVAPVVEEDGAILGAVLLADDASTLERLERQRDAFLTLASHELKTPLTSIKLLSQMTTRQLARLGLPVPPQADHMEHAIARLERLVNDLLDSSRGGDEPIELCREVCDLGALCRKRIAEIAEMTDREITLAQPEAAVPVSVDAERLGQVLMNLLLNAVKYSPVGLPIVVEVTASADEAQVSVRDHGAGIAPDAMVHLFQRFYRVPGIEVQAGSHVGFGLGLYLCRQILTRHGGRIWAESAPGEGSTFTFALPLAGEVSPSPTRSGEPERN